MKTPIQQFRELKTDQEKWQFLIDNKDCGLTVNCDYDHMYVTHKDDIRDSVYFDGDGEPTLLDTLGITHESRR